MSDTSVYYATVTATAPLAIVPFGSTSANAAPAESLNSYAPVLGDVVTYTVADRSGTRAGTLLVLGSCGSGGGASGSDTGWHYADAPGEPKLSANFYNVSGGTYTPFLRWRRDAAGCVFLESLLSIAPSTSTVLITLPVGYRPAYDLWLTGWSTTVGICSWVVRANGDVLLWGGNAGVTAASGTNGCTWIAEDAPGAPAWVTPTPAGGWNNYVGTGGKAPLRYCIDSAGDVHLSGMIYGGGTGSANAFLVLPAGAFDTTYAGIFNVTAYPGNSAAGARVDVNTSGQVFVQLYTGSGLNTWISLDGIVIANPNGDWTTPALGASWVNYGGIYEPFGWCVNKYGVLAMRGLIKSGTGGAFSAAGNIPYPPVFQQIFSVAAGNNGLARIDVADDGSVSLVGAYVNGGTNAYLSTKGRWFADDQGRQIGPTGATGPQGPQGIQGVPGTGGGGGGGGLVLRTVPVSTNYTAVNGDYVEVNAAGGPVTVTVPNTAGTFVGVTKMDSSASTVTVVASSGTVSGDPSAQIITQHASATFIGDGTNVVVVASYPSLLVAPNWTIRAVSTAYTAHHYEFVLADASAGPVTVTVPVAAGAIVDVKKTDASANAVTVVASSGGQVNHAASLALASQDASALVVGDGVNANVAASSGSGGGTPSRATATATTSSLVAAATDSTTAIALAVGYRLYSIQTSRPARVRLYETAAQKTADLSRPVGTDPLGDAGVALEFVATDAAVHTLSPLVDGASLETTPSASIPMTVTNNDTATGTVTVTLAWIRTE